MKIPQLKKKPERKSCHNVAWEDNYSWIHQENILEVLKDGSKLLPEVRKYLEEENSYTCLLYTSPSPRDRTRSRMPSSA